MSDITWSNETRKLSDLIPQRDNPRHIRKPQAERLVKSWDKFNQPDVISIGPDNKIYNGHQRYYVWQAAYGDDFEVAVRVSSRKLTRREWQEMTVVMHEGAIGEWDFDTLADWDGVDIGDLVEWGFEEYKFTGGWGDTSTDRDGQGISSTWDQVKNSENDKVIIGNIETRLPKETITALSKCLTNEFDENGTPFFESLNVIVLLGVNRFENSNS